MNMYTKRELKTFLESICLDARFVKCNFVSAENFFVAIKSKVDPEAGITHYQEYFADFIRKFGKFTSTTWIVRTSHPKVVRFVYRKVYACHLSSFNKKKVLQKQCKERNKHCKAKIDFKVKKWSRGACKNDKYLRDNLNLNILIQFEHSHSVHDREHFNLLRGSKESDEKIYEYFDRGFTAASAKYYHEMLIIEQHGNDVERLSNSNINPSINHITYLYTRYRKEREKEIRSVNSLMAEKKTNLENAGGTLIYTDNAEIALVITPFMKRVFTELSSDVIIVESTRINKFVLTHFYVPSKVGVLPIACALHASQDEDNFSQTFLTVKITIENIHLGRHLEPKIVMSNDLMELTNAVSAIFPQTKRVSIPIDICRNFWAWLCDNENNCHKKKRHSLMILFRQMIYAESFELSEQNYKELLVNEYPELKEYLEGVWNRREEWSQNEMYEFYERHIVESSLIFFKELLIQRCKYFSVHTMVDVLVNVIDGHFCRVLQIYAKGEENLTFLTKFLEREQDIVGFDSETETISPNEYRRASKLKTKKHFAFRTDTLCCNCSIGAKGYLCEHLCGIINAVDTEFNRLPRLDDRERVFFTQLSGVDPEELKNIKTEVSNTNGDVSNYDDKEFERDFSADDDDDVDPDYQPDDGNKTHSSPKVEDDDDSNDYYVLDVKSEKPERADPLEEFLMDDGVCNDGMTSQSKAIRESGSIEPELPPEEFKPTYEKALKELNSEFRRLNKLFKENANRGNLATMKKLTTELAKIRPIERVNLKNLFVELNAEVGPPEKKMKEGK